MIVAYTRISTGKEAQKMDRQLEQLKQYAASNNFTFDSIAEERISGTVKTDSRPIYSDLKEKTLREGDILVITDLDRLGRSADNVISELKDLKAKGIRVVALDIPHMNEWEKVQDSGMYDMIIDLIITLKAYMAQQEREKMVDRINAGLDAARAKGTKLGRPKAELPKDFVKQYKKFRRGEYGDITATGFAKMLGIGRSTLYKYIGICEEK